MHEDKFWESLTRGAGVFRILVLVIVIALIIYVVLRIVMPAVNDRRTRKILIEGMSGDAKSSSDSSDDAGESPPRDDPR